MMKNYDESVKINHKPIYPYISDHPYSIVIIGGSGSGKTNVLLNLIQHQRPDIVKIYLYVKDPFESKYQLLINGRKNGGIKRLKNLKAFIDYSQTIDYVYENLIVLKRKKSQYFTCFYFTILFLFTILFKVP